MITKVGEPLLLHLICTSPTRAGRTPPGVVNEGTSFESTNGQGQPGDSGDKTRFTENAEVSVPGPRSAGLGYLPGKPNDEGLMKGERYSTDFNAV